MLSQQNSVPVPLPCSQDSADPWPRVAAITLVFCLNFVQSHLSGGPGLRELGSCM